MKFGLSVAMLFGLLSLASPAAAMDCAKAATVIEKLVCGRPELKELDELVEKLYPATLRVAQDAETLASTQRDWRAGIEACNGYECVEDSYGDRLERLTGYFREVQAPDAVTIATASGDKACVRMVLPQRPTIQPTCRRCSTSSPWGGSAASSGSTPSIRRPSASTARISTSSPR